MPRTFLISPCSRPVPRALALAVATSVMLACRDRALRSSRAFEVHDATARPAQTGDTAIVTLRFVNGADDAITVSGFTSDAAPTTVFVRANGIPAASVTLPSGGTLVMRRGGDHLELRGVTHPLTDGEWVPITMRLSTGAIVSALARVR